MVDSGVALAESIESISSTLKTPSMLGASVADVRVKAADALLHLSSVLREYAEHQRPVLATLDNFVVSLDDGLFVSRLRQATESHSKFNAMSDERDMLLEKVRHPKNFGNSVIDQELTAKEEQLERARLLASTHLCQADVKCRVDLLLGFCWVVQEHRKATELSVKSFDSNSQLNIGKVVENVRELERLVDKKVTENEASLQQYLDTSKDPSKVTSMQGYLFKHTSHGAWKRRWFIVQKGDLEYSKHGAEDARWSKTLLNCSVRQVSSKDSAINPQYCFEIVAPPPLRCFQLQATSTASRLMWMNAITHNIAYAIENQSMPSPRLAIQNMVADNVAKRSRWRDLLQINGNSKCVDCGAAAPEWVSINLGVCMCIACSGVHRSLGAHISKVRSLVLDDFEPGVFEMPELIGNDRFNSIAFANNPPPLPTESATRQEMEAFLRRKYVSREWFAPLRDASHAWPEAVKCGDPCRVLLSLLVDPQTVAHTRDARGSNALHLAITHQLEAMAVLLVLNLPDVNTPNAEGSTPLHLACQHNLLSIAALLLKRDASSHATDRNGNTPLDLATTDECRALILGQDPEVEIEVEAETEEDLISEGFGKRKSKSRFKWIPRMLSPRNSIRDKRSEADVPAVGVLPLVRDEEAGPRDGFKLSHASIETDSDSESKPSGDTSTPRSLPTIDSPKALQRGSAEAIEIDSGSRLRKKSIPFG
eukprot:c19756_g1_i2.p1 GENE.c19756_g1_i2~~c19756_g1_i2.p1  ORF type:complete len:788 (-),score=179.52 c19756_g1_i2:118-2241(-)